LVQIRLLLNWIWTNPLNFLDIFTEKRNARASSIHKNALDLVSKGHIQAALPQFRQVLTSMTSTNVILILFTFIMFALNRTACRLAPTKAALLNDLGVTELRLVCWTLIMITLWSWSYVGLLCIFEYHRDCQGMQQIIL
jgi:hypothetical protein